MSEGKCSIAQIMSINMMSNNNYYPELLKQSIVLHYGNGHVWTQMGFHNKIYVGNRIINIHSDDICDKVVFLDTKERESYPFDGRLHSSIVYASSDGKTICTYCSHNNTIYQYVLKEGKYRFTNKTLIDSPNAIRTKFISDYGFFCVLDDYDDRYFYLLIHMPTLTIQILPYSEMNIENVVHEFYSYHFDGLHVHSRNDYLHHQEYVITNISRYQLSYWSHGDNYTINTSNSHGNVVDLSDIRIWKDNLVYISSNRHVKRFYILNLKLNKEISTFIEYNSYILAKDIKIPINKDKLHSIPMYQKKINYQGYEDYLKLEYNPESVAVFVDLLHYGKIDTDNTDIMIDVSKICDYVGCFEQRDIAYDHIYYSCLQDVNKFVEVISADVDDVITQMMADMCLIYYDKMEIPYYYFQKAIRELYKYDCHYHPRTSFRPHYFIQDNGLSWLDM